MLYIEKYIENIVSFIVMFAWKYSLLPDLLGFTVKAERPVYHHRSSFFTVCSSWLWQGGCSVRVTCIRPTHTVSAFRYKDYIIMQLFSRQWSGVCRGFQRTTKWNLHNKVYLDGSTLISTMGQTQWWVLFYYLWNTKKHFWIVLSETTWRSD